LNEKSYLDGQVVIEIMALTLGWILVLLYVFDITSIKEWMVASQIVGTVAVTWWIAWERHRLPKTA